MSWVLRHSAKIYQNKINELERYRTSLDTHLETLRGYQSQVRQYWDDEHGQNYYNLLTEQIEAVQRANNRIERLKITYQDALDDFSNSGSMIDDLLEDAKSVTQLLG